MKRSKLLLVSGLLVAGACIGDRPRSPLGPSAVIRDAAHDASVVGFWFLPPMVPNPSIDKPFNAFLHPLVRICEFVDPATCTTVAEFTRSTGPGSETIRVSTTDQHYIVNWHTDQFGVDPGDTYRIEVFADEAGSFSLGFADVEIAATGKEARNLSSSGQVIGLVDGRTLSVKFFAGIGALGQCEPDVTCAEAIVPTSGGLVVAVNAEGVAEAFADFPAEWNDVPTTVRISRLPDEGAPFQGPLGAPEGARQWPTFYEFEAFVENDGVESPAGAFVKRVRIGVCNIESAFGDELHPEDRARLSLGIGGQGAFRTLPLANASDILGMCDGVTTALRSGDLDDGLQRLLNGAAALAWSVVAPKPLHAATTGLVVDGGMGGSTDNFASPVGTVEGKPDLRVTQLGEGGEELPGLTMFPVNPVVGEPVTFTAVITNLGEGADAQPLLHAGRTFARLDVTGEESVDASCPASELLTASLGPGESCVIERTVTFTEAGNYTVTAIADAVDNLASEWDEENNTASLQFTVSNAEDPDDVAFISNRDGNVEIYVMDGDGSEPTRLTNNAGLDVFPRWSPDRSKIAFGRGAEVGGSFALWVMNADGTGAMRLSPDGVDDDARWFAWSPDGTKIAFVRRLGRAATEIFVMHADGTGETQLTGLERDVENLDPQWSPDNRILFQSNRDGNFELYVMDPDGGNQTRLTEDPAIDHQARWSPDGEAITFVRGPLNGNSEIYVMNVDGTGETNLTNNLAGDQNPEWSPDGAKILFLTNRDEDPEIYSINADGSALTNLTNNAAFDRNAQWSPDGTRILFTTDRTGNDEIFVMRATGAGLINLTNHPSSDGAGTWAPFFVIID